MKAGLLWWGTAQIMRHGFPNKVVDTFVGLGDELMAAAALRELHTRGKLRGTWFLTRYPEMHADCSLPVAFLPWDARYKRIGIRLRRPSFYLAYEASKTASHCIVQFARTLGLTGPVSIKPHLELDDETRAKGRRYPRQIAVQSSSQGARIPIPAKQWPHASMQDVVNQLKKHYDGTIIQVGTHNEPALEGTEDMRGKLSIRETAGVLANSDVFIGLAGGLMHLARAVECRSVVVYGGREPADFAGYQANINLVDTPECSPCFLSTPCPYDIKCLRAITPEMVLSAVRQQLAQSGPLPVETVTL